MFRHNTAFEGTILAEPYFPRPKKHLEPYRGLGVQLTFQSTLIGEPPKGTLDHPYTADPRDLDDPALLPWPPERSNPYPMTDGHDRRTGDLGWSDRPTPVLWTRWSQPMAAKPADPARMDIVSGLVLRQEVFVRPRIIQDVETGVEPLYCWIRLSIETPPAWFSPSERTRFERFPTVFGPVSLSFQLTDDGKTLDVAFEAQYHHAPGCVILHAPPFESLQKVVINGSANTAQGGDEISIRMN